MGRWRWHVGLQAPPSSLPAGVCSPYSPRALWRPLPALHQNRTRAEGPVGRRRDLRCRKRSRTPRKHAELTSTLGGVAAANPARPGHLHPPPGAIPPAATETASRAKAPESVADLETNPSREAGGVCTGPARGEGHEDHLRGERGVGAHGREDGVINTPMLPGAAPRRHAVSPGNPVRFEETGNPILKLRGMTKDLNRQRNLGKEQSGARLARLQG